MILEVGLHVYLYFFLVPNISYNTIWAVFITYSILCLLQIFYLKISKHCKTKKNCEVIKVVLFKTILSYLSIIFSSFFKLSPLGFCEKAK
jgi:hypothetical protein